MRGGSRKRCRKSVGGKVNFTDDEKRKLASLVEMHSEVWNLAHPSHRKPETHLKSWETISAEMNHNVEACKKAWKSLRDGLRYRKAPKRDKKKSGDSGPEDSDSEPVDEPDDELLTWPFWECMKFVACQKSNRTTISTLEPETEKSGEVEANDSSHEIGQNAKTTNDDSVNDLSTPKKQETSMASTARSNYSYAVSRKKARNDDPADKLATGIADLIKIRKDAVGAAKAEPLMYHSIYVNLDRMLKQLPAAAVEDLNMQFSTLAYEAIKRQEAIVIVNNN